MSSLRLMLLTLLAAVAVPSGEARAGEGVGPHGTTIPVTVDASGRITAPATVDLVVRLDALDVDPRVVVGSTPELVGGVPAGGAVTTCTAGELRPVSQPEALACQVPASSLSLTTTYYWWLVTRRPDAPDELVSGPFTFTLARDVPEPAPKPSRTFRSAATLPSRTGFDGTSVKHTVLTSMLYRLMKQLGAPRRLAVACWDEQDFASVAQSAKAGPVAKDDFFLDGFWLRTQPRWLHLAPTPCKQVQALIDSGQPNGHRAAALATAIHETLHAHGVINEAMTNCFAVQLVPYAAQLLRMPPTRARYLGKLAVSKIRATAPPGYWNAWFCRDGGRWDLDRSSPNLA
jgi:hypothetical protein